jgi:PRTRC genetic system protein E
MFQQLVPLLRHRSVLLTVTSLEDDQISVNVLPQMLADSENAALTTPMSFTGTPAELDAKKSAPADVPVKKDEQKVIEAVEVAQPIRYAHSAQREPHASFRFGRRSRDCYRNESGLENGGRGLRPSCFVAPPCIWPAQPPWPLRIISGAGVLYVRAGHLTVGRSMLLPPHWRPSIWRQAKRKAADRRQRVVSQYY